MSEKLVSVIIPTHNRGNLITETIESVLAQSYGNIEILIVDNGSTDDTENIIKKIKTSRIQYFKQENSGGPAGPRNVGIRKSRGEYIAFLDSDDIWLPDKIKKQVEILECKPETGLVYCKAEFFGDGFPKGKTYPGKGYSGEVFDKLICGNFVPTISVLARRETILKTGDFDESKSLRAFEDYELWMRIARHYHFHFIDEALCRLRMHTQNMLGTDNMKSHLGAMRAFCSACDKLALPGPVRKPAFSHHCLTTAMAWLEVGNYTNFKIFLERSMREKTTGLNLAICLSNAILGGRLFGKLYPLVKNFLKKRR